MNWHKELGAARSVEDVMAIANDYFAAARVALADRLPESALPAEVATITELHAVQGRVVDAFMANPVFGLDTGIQDLCVFAIRALARGLELSAKTPNTSQCDVMYRASSFDDRVEL